MEPVRAPVGNARWGLRRIHRQRHRWNVRVRVHVPKRHPGAMVNSGSLIDTGVESGARKLAGDFGGQLRSALGGLLDSITARQSHRSHGSFRRQVRDHHRFPRHEVRRSHDHGARSRQRGAQAVEERPVGEFSSGIIGEPWDRKSEGSELGAMGQRPGLNVSSHASRRH